MAQYIDKSALVAEIESKRNDYINSFMTEQVHVLNDVLDFINTLEVKEVGIGIPNVDDLLEEDGINPYSKDAKLFKECYYTALEKYKEKKGIV